MNLLEQICPLCKTSRVRLLKKLESNKIIKIWALSNIDVAEQFRSIDYLELWECETCYLKFFLPKLIEGPMDLYSKLEKFDWYYMPRKWEHDVAINDIKGRSNILEIGCGFGAFVQRVIEEKKLRVIGIELNESAVIEAQKKNLPVRLLNLTDAVKLYKGQFDVVCSFQVLEHVPNPDEFLKCSCDLLKPGGKLILGIPNADSFIKYQFNFLDMPPHHLTRWSREVLKYIPNQYPLLLKNIKIEPLAEYHIDSYVNVYLPIIDKRFFGNNLHHYINKQQVVQIIRKTGIRRLLTGQSLYVSYIRN